MSDNTANPKEVVEVLKKTESKHTEINEVHTVCLTRYWKSYQGDTCVPTLASYPIITTSVPQPSIGDKKKQTSTPLTVILAPPKINQ